MSKIYLKQNKTQVFILGFKILQSKTKFSICVGRRKKPSVKLPCRHFPTHHSLKHYKACAHQPPKHPPNPGKPQQTPMCVGKLFEVQEAPRNLSLV